jgi:hypothetical protein
VIRLELGATAADDVKPKSTGWKIRSVMGVRRKWYNPVETTQTVGEFGIWRVRERE